MDGQIWGALGFAGAILATVVVVRLGWVAVYRMLWSVLRWDEGAAPVPTAAGGLVVGWCGMRGIVTLATALALPGDFPQRDLLLFTAFVVTLGTLVIQGMTIRPLLAAVQLPADDSVDKELALGRREAARAVLDRHDGALQAKGSMVLRRTYEEMLKDEEGSPGQDLLATIGALRRDALATEREALLRLRAEGRIGEVAYHQLEEELDWKEAE